MKVLIETLSAGLQGKRKDHKYFGISTKIYAAEALSLTTKQESKFETASMKMNRWACGKILEEKIKILRLFARIWEWCQPKCLGKCV